MKKLIDGDSKFIDEDPLLLKYFRKRHLVENTKGAYRYHFHKYYIATGLTPSEAIEEADEDEENGIRIKRRRISERLDTFEEFLEDEEYSENHLTHAIAIVKGFYRFHGIELPINQRRPPGKTPDQELTDLPDSDDIIRALGFANVKYSAMIVLLASTGMRIGDLKALTLGNFVDSISEYIQIEVSDLADIDNVIKKLPKVIGPLTWTIWNQKNKKIYTTFSTPESLKYILEFLHHKPPKDPESDTILFGNQRGNIITQPSIHGYFARINELCKFPDTNQKYIYFRPHNLRKWFGNQLKKTELGYIETRILMGHKVQDDTGRRYLKPDYPDLKKKYYRNMDNVTLFGKVEVHDLTDERVEKLEDRLNRLEEENEMLRAHREAENRQ